MVRGQTVLIPKTEDPKGQDQYQPITCLNNTNTLYTVMLATLLMEHVKQYDLLPEEQKALRKGTRGCLDALVIDEAIARETKLFGRNLSLGWVDYCKAYDMVPHLWIRKMMKAIRTPLPLRRVIKHLIPLWETEIAQYTTKGTRSARIALVRGFAQGDSLSPLLFCMEGANQAAVSHFHPTPSTCCC